MLQTTMVMYSFQILEFVLDSFARVFELYCKLGQLEQINESLPLVFFPKKVRQKSDN